MKKRILCFGDSLTWGFDPDTKTRFDEGIRWTSVLQEKLGSDYIVIEEGQNGRTIASDDPSEGEKNGMLYVGPCLESHKPLDLMIVMLGTNNLKPKFGLCSMDIAGQMQIMVEKILSINHFKFGDAMKLIIVAPPCVGEKIRDSWLGDSFGYEKAIATSKELASWYKTIAEQYNIGFIDAAQYVVVSDSDSIHMDARNQHKLGKVIYASVKELIG
ncbi:MAG: SGNH/GDSL hydrolase family protein [Clostridia bacterium]|nr:SGNH/GDSL hydrolase family protein [Clostridia bacterium]